MFVAFRLGLPVQGLGFKARGCGAGSVVFVAKPLVLGFGFWVSGSRCSRL